MRGVIIYGARNMALAERARDVAIRTEFPIVHALDKRQARTGRDDHEFQTDMRGRVDQCVLTTALHVTYSREATLI